MYGVCEVRCVFAFFSLPSFAFFGTFIIFGAPIDCKDDVVVVTVFFMRMMIIYLLVLFILLANICIDILSSKSCTHQSLNQIMFTFFAFISICHLPVYSVNESGGMGGEMCSHALHKTLQSTPVIRNQETSI